MQNIKQAIYALPEIRHCIKPLWSAWIIVLIGALCGAIYLIGGGMSPSLSSLFLYMAALGVLTLLFIICFYLFGDSCFPYSKPLHRCLEPTPLTTPSRRCHNSPRPWKKATKLLWLR